MKISVVISTFNRSASLKRTLESVVPFADEIIVVNSGSTDDTVGIAKKYTPNVFTRQNNLMLNVNKNYGFSKASGDWILNLDDDEIVPQDLAREIRSRIKTAPEDISGYWIPRKNIIFGKWIRHGLWWPDTQLRLFRAGTGKFPEKHVHEYIEVHGKTETIHTAFTHYNYDSIGQYLLKMQTLYIQSEVDRYVSTGYRVRWEDALRFPVSDFLKIYFAQSGYKDGLHGLVLATLQSYYSFLIFAVLWERQKFIQLDIPLSCISNEYIRSTREASYWLDTAKLKTTRNILHTLWLKLHRRYVSAR